MPRPRAWGDKLFRGTDLVAGTAQQFDLLATLTPSDTITVTRLVGHLTMMITVPWSSITTAMAIHIGIGVASAEAFALGATALPTLTTAGDTPARGWLYRDIAMASMDN